jgi:hypothetical protein
MIMKNKLMKVFIAILIVCAASVAVAGRDNGWQMIMDKENIKGYSRSVEGSDILEFRSSVIANAKIEVVGAILRNVEGLKEASSHCTEVRFLEKTDINNYIFYVAYSYPPPIADRDMIVKVSGRYDYNMGRVISDLRALSEPLVPLKKNCIRITNYRAQFIVEYINREKTNIVYTSMLDPGGSIPKVLANFMSKLALESSGLDLQEAIKNKKYIDAAMNSYDHEIVEKLVKDKGVMKNIYANRLGEYIKDREFVELIVNDNIMFDKLSGGEGEFGEIIRYGWGSESSKKKSVELLLKLYLETFIRDGEVIHQIIGNNDLAERILHGKGGTELLKVAINNYKK